MDRSDDLKRIALELADLIPEKNRAYGSSFETCGPALQLLYPEGLRPDQYVDALLIARIWDKLMRISTAKSAFGESPYRDIAGYGILGVALDGDKS
jgi:hypothetical protein